MLYEVTLHPSVFDRCTDRVYWNSVAHILQGMFANCVFANLWSGELLNEVGRRLKSLDHGTADTLRRLLDRLRDLRRIHPRPPAGGRMPRSNPEWLDEALLSHSRCALFAIIARDAVLSASPPAIASGVCVPVEGAGTNTLWNGRTHAQQVPRCRGCVLPLLAPVLERSRKVHVVDYVIARALLNPRRSPSAARFRDAIGQCIHYWGRDRRPRTEFVIHTELPRNETLARCASAFHPWRSALRYALPADASRVLIRVWSSTTGRYFQRNRFLLSEIVALKLGKGFDLFPGTSARQTENVAILPEESARLVESEFAQLRLEGEIGLR